MGRNTDIRQFDARPAGQPMDLLGSTNGVLPVVRELLGSPWLRRASDLPPGPGSGKRTEVVVDVEWDGVRGRPSAFLYKGKRHAVDTVAGQWALESAWWDRSRAVDRRCFRVLARGGVWDLAYDKAHDTWLLVGVVD